MKKIKLLTIIGLSVATIISGSLLINNNKVTASNPTPVAVEKLVVNSLPNGVELKSREVLENGVKFVYSNDAEPQQFKILELELLKPGAKVQSLIKQGQGDWLPPAESKTKSINNVPVELKVQIDPNEGIPWLQLTLKQNDKIINAFSRNFTEEELIKAISSVDITNEKLKDNKQIRNQMKEIDKLIQGNNLKDKNKIISVLSPYKEKGWIINEVQTSGESNTLIAVEANENKQTITLFIGNGK